MAAVQILRVARTDAKGRYMLLHVTQQSEAKPLNLKLVATEYEHVYHSNINESSLKSLQHSSFTGNLDEWKSVVQFALLNKRPAGAFPESCHGLELAAAISGDAVTVTLRKNISGIKQGLGAIQLEQDDEKEEINGFEWAEVAVSHLDSSRAKLDELEAALASQKEEMSKLSAQLDDLMQAKRDHEQELLKKFVVLLNAKKKKIRDQHRLLSGHPKVWHDDSDDVLDAVPVDDIKSSRRGKRKANGEVKAESAESDNGFEADPQSDDGEGGADFNGDETSQPMEEESTEDENENENSAPPAHGKSDRQASSDTMDVEQEDDNTSKRTMSRRQSQQQIRQTISRDPDTAITAVADDDEATDDEL